MDDIGGYLKKFSNIIKDGSHLKKEIIDEIGVVTGVVIKKEDIKIKDGVVNILSSPVIRNSIYIKKAYILRKLKERGVKISDIL